MHWSYEKRCTLALFHKTEPFQHLLYLPHLSSFAQSCCKWICMKGRRALHWLQARCVLDDRRAVFPSECAQLMNGVYACAEIRQKRNLGVEDASQHGHVHQKDSVCCQFQKCDIGFDVKTSILFSSSACQILMVCQGRSNSGCMQEEAFFHRAKTHRADI